MPTVIASALFWSWFDTVLFRPTLFLPFGGTTQLYEPYFVIALGLGALPLLIAAFRPRSIDPLLARRSSWVAVTAASVLGGMTTAIGAWSSSLPLVVGGAVLVGSCLGCYQLLWARSYAAGGARSAVTLVSLSIVLGALLDFSIFGLPPIVGALLTVAMSFVSLLLVLMASRLAAPLNEREPQRPTPLAKPNADTADSMSAPRRTTPFDTLFEGSRHRLFGLPLALVLSFLVYGFSFGYDQYISVFADTALDSLSSDMLLISRGLTALIVFFAVQLFPAKMYTVFRIGILVGIAGCVISPSIETLVGSSLLVGPIMAIGYATFDIITWTLLAEITYKTGVGAAATIGAGRFLIHMGEVVGCLVVMLFLANAPSEGIMQTLNATVGYLMIIAEMLLLEENSALWMLIRMNVSPTGGIPVERAGTPGTDMETALSLLAEKYGLTDREIDVLRLLLIGRSRPRIAQSLGVSENTVNSHVQQIYRKLGVHSRQELLDLVA